MNIRSWTESWINIDSNEQTYSYTPMMIELLDSNNFWKILEWGSGRSSLLIHSYQPEAEFHTIEHDWKWFFRWKMKFPRKIKIHYIPLNKGYSNPRFPNDYFDFIFVDGRQRVQCLRSALRLLEHGGYIILHDSHRKEYQEGTKLFKKIKEGNDTLLMRKI